MLFSLNGIKLDNPILDFVVKIFKIHQGWGKIYKIKR